MDESAYLSLADRAFCAIEDGLQDADADTVDCERAGDVLTLTFKGNRRCVLNTQRPTRQLWLAANARAWHFSYDIAKKQWLDDKGHEEELLSTLAGIVQELGGIKVDFG
jgi:CyaY protein